ncbi:nucleotidyltransferase domain-containing protein [Bacillus sp. FJAT-29790]|uniref:nucleotidyltransferase domain-containing protein n=1 Tax=Bacillus sp. FJAT-29790 TaxID=1895002 RepID=UPI001C239C99|nr:nucleotidyltransferase domain-containing protein [Bacillus sp. FJAT-29790]MBU8878749.1 nucleotidyltransferase domain-containing protein [Bacillus sp. FJAT-29790]
MREHIIEVIKQIEIDYEVKVLYACESGSRAWGFPSKDSDYDVRFIYIHKKDWYLSIDQKRDVIEIPKHDSLSIPVDELLDVSGWEITKALKLFRKSNPPLLEWMHSSIVYYQAFSTIDKMKTLAENIFAPPSCLYHYLNMAKGNYRDYLQGEEIKIKKYFYVLRPILAAKWIKKYNSIPPILFQRLLEDILPAGELKNEIETLLKRKMAGEELDLEPRITLINQFLNEEIEHLEAYAKSLDIYIQDPTKQFDQLFRETLAEVWN